MSMTFTDRYEVVRSISAVQSSRRWRVARPRRPGTRPSAARRSSAAIPTDSDTCARVQGSDGPSEDGARRSTGGTTMTEAAEFAIPASLGRKRTLRVTSEGVEFNGDHMAWADVEHVTRHAIVMQFALFVRVKHA